MYIILYIYIYIPNRHVLKQLSSKVLNAVNRAIDQLIYTMGFDQNNKTTIPCHYTVSWINSNLPMATVYLVFLKSMTVL